MHEVVRFDEITKEKHIADIKTDRGLVIEIQHSAMPIEELIAREAFYKNMIWIVDGRPFADQFKIFSHPLPHPNSSLLDDVVFYPGRNWMFWRRSENKPNATMVLVHDGKEIENQIRDHYKGHHFFEWKRPRDVWLQAKAPVLIDFGGQELYRIQEYQSTVKHCVQRISKQALIEKNGGTYEAENSANA